MHEVKSCLKSINFPVVFLTRKYSLGSQTTDSQFNICHNWYSPASKHHCWIPNQVFIILITNWPVNLDFGIPNQLNSAMESIDTEIAARIRNDIILGNYITGDRLSETRLCDAHNVSRTPVRLALRILESEGIIQRGEGRGYTVQSPTVADILQAVQVRGHLESLAARLMAQSPDRSEHLPEMAQAIETMNEQLESGRIDEPMIHTMHAANKVFHSTILDACGNDYVSFTCKQISHLPMLAVGSMVFDRSVLETEEGTERGLFRLRIGNAQHQVIYDAIQNGDAVRAEAMTREHSNIMLEYIETFEKKDGQLSVNDLVAYSATDSDHT